VNADLACGSCAGRLSEMRGTCLMCGREPDGVRLDVEHRIELLLRLRAALLTSAHIYASYELSLVEQELRGYGIDPCDPPPLPLREGEGGDSAAVGDSAVSSTAPCCWVNSSGCRDAGGGCSAHESDRDSRTVAAFLPVVEG
jgi:hypothetical protein